MSLFYTYLGLRPITVNTPIIDPQTPERNPASPIRYHRIAPIILHTGVWLHIADGVIEVDGSPYLGQVTGAGPAFRVAGFLVGNHYAYPAPVGWRADILASSSLNGRGDEPPPSPAVAWMTILVQPPLCEVAA
jgi:hypothetical protein